MADLVIGLAAEEPRQMARGPPAYRVRGRSAAVLRVTGMSS